MNSLNLATLSLSADDLKAIQAAIQVLQDRLLPHLITLTPADRKELPKMGDKTVSFVQKAAQYARAYPSLVPSYIDVDALERDIQVVDQLGQLFHPLEHLISSLDDSLMAAGSEAYASSLSFYQAAKAAAKGRVHGAQAIADDLGQRFPARTKTTTSAEPSPAKSA